MWTDNSAFAFLASLLHMKRVWTDRVPKSMSTEEYDDEYYDEVEEDENDYDCYDRDCDQYNEDEDVPLEDEIPFHEPHLPLDRIG